MTKRHVPLVVGAAAALILSGCAGGGLGDLPAELSETTTTTPTTTYPRTTSTTTSPAAQPEANPTHLPIAPTDAVQIIGDIEKFWATRGVTLDVTDRQVDGSIECEGKRYNSTPALYCDTGNQVIYKTLPEDMLTDPAQMVLVQTILSHEMGHAVQDFAGKLQGAAGDRKMEGGIAARELSADCLAGVYMATQTPTARSHEMETPERTAAYQLGLNLPDGAQEQCLTKWGG